MTRAFAAWVLPVGLVPGAELCPAPLGEQKVSPVAWNLARRFPGSALPPPSVLPGDGDGLHRTQPLLALGLPLRQLGQTSAT